MIKEKLTQTHTHTTNQFSRKATKTKLEFSHTLVPHQNYMINIIYERKNTEKKNKIK